MQSVLSTHLLECYKLECVSLAFFHIICYHINLTKLLLLKVLFFFFAFPTAQEMLAMHALELSFIFDYNVML